jgi:Family of unknown function (DUF5752)
VRNSEPFVFYTEQRLIALTGMRASTLPELLTLMRRVPGSSIFYHTHHIYLAHHFERPTFTNDFARWVGEALQEEELAEKMAAVDLLEHTSIRSLRERFLELTEMSLQSGQHELRRCPRGDDFHFCRSRSFSMTSGLVAHSPEEFFRVLPHVTTASIFYHSFEARLRLKHRTNDFSHWLTGQGERDLAREIAMLNPYAQTLEELRTGIIRLGEARFGGAG